jgi:signal recognition particle subunit SRP54
LKDRTSAKQEKEFKHMEAMICGMTPKERAQPRNPERQTPQRIAKGSGVTVTELNTMLNKFARCSR